MSSSGRSLRFPNFVISNWLFVILLSPLSHLPGYSGSYPASNLERNSAGCSAGNPVRNPESHLVCYSVSYSAGYPERNSASCPESSRESNWEDSSSDCSENCPASSPESNLPSNEAGNPLSYSESYPADSPASCLGNFGQSPACLAVIRLCSPLPTPYSRLPPALPRHHDLADSDSSSLLTPPCSLAHKVHSRRQRAHVIRARLKVQHPPPAHVHQEACA